MIIEHVAVTICIPLVTFKILVFIRRPVFCLKHVLETEFTLLFQAASTQLGPEDTDVETESSVRNVIIK
jgi:hypothetical protein